MSALSIAASGMRAADLRLQVAARNIANAGSIGSVPNADGVREARAAYRPVQVVLSTIDGGGVKAEVREKDWPYVETSSPSSVHADSRGIVAAPNVDLASELTEVMSAEMSFKASAMVVRVSSRMFDALIDALDSGRNDRQCRDACRP
jgi:flagellar basal-body rod protein FlgC